MLDGIRLEVLMPATLLFFLCAGASAIQGDPGRLWSKACYQPLIFSMDMGLSVVSISGGTPKNGWFLRENHIKMI